MIKLLVTGCNFVILDILDIEGHPNDECSIRSYSFEIYFKKFPNTIYISK